MFDTIIFTDVTDNIGAAKPIGAYKCAHSLREHDYTCLVVDNFHCFTAEELLQLLDIAVGPTTRMIGFSNTFLANSNKPKNPDGSTPPYDFLEGSLFFPQGQEVENLVISSIRKKNQNIKIVIGGARANPNESSRNIDYVVIGYSEISIVNLMDHLDKGAELKKATKNIWGKIVIDDRKAEEYDFANSTMNWLPIDVVNQTVLSLEIARGCIFKCKFCAYPMNGKKQLDFVRNATQLQYELEKNYNEYGIFRYSISDDTFNDNDYKLELLLSAIKKLKFQPEFWAYTRLDLLARNIDKNFQKLYDIGLRATQFGIETLNEPTGKIIGKGYSKSKQIAAVQSIRKKFENKVSLHGTFIAGLPEESEESCCETNSLLETQELPLHSWHWRSLYIFKNSRVAWNSEIGIDYKKYGYTATSIDKHTILIDWENKHTNFSRATELANTFNHSSDSGQVMRLPNVLGWSILPLGYEPKFITDSIFSQINFNEIEHKKKQFMIDYKNQLFDLLKQKS